MFDAYGWPHDLSDDEILERLVALNAERSAEEERGLVRWLRPEFQNPTGTKAATQTTFVEEEPESEPAMAAKAKAKAPWPRTMAEQAQAVRTALSAVRGPVTAEQLAKGFIRARTDRVEALLDTLASLGQARRTADGRYAAPATGR